MTFSWEIYSRCLKSALPAFSRAGKRWFNFDYSGPISERDDKELQPAISHGLAIYRR